MSHIDSFSVFENTQSFQSVHSLAFKRDCCSVTVATVCLLMLAKSNRWNDVEDLYTGAMLVASTLSAEKTFLQTSQLNPLFKSEMPASQGRI